MNISQFSFTSSGLKDAYHKRFYKSNAQSTISTTNQSNKIDSINQIKGKTNLPDKVVEDIQQMAREDAKNEIYMDDKYVSYINNYKAEHISPNRSKLMAMFNPMIMNAQYTDGKSSFFSIQGFPGFTAEFSVGAAFGAYVSITDAHGDEILSYTPPPNGGWQSSPTREESAFHDKVTDIYHAAYHEARAEIKAAQQHTSATTATNNFDVSV